jgi:chromate transport protein ChrA
MTLCTVVILCVEIYLRMNQNSNKFIKKSIIFNAFILSLCAISIVVALVHKYYNINSLNTIFKKTLCILVILCVEMNLQLIQNSNKLKYYSITFVLIFECSLCDKGSRTYCL